MVRTQEDDCRLRASLPYLDSRHLRIGLFRRRQLLDDGRRPRHAGRGGRSLRRDRSDVSRRMSRCRQSRQRDGFEKKYPEMAKRILDQRSMFGIRAIEEKETISNRFKYYPKLFSLMRQAIEKEYKCTGNLMKRQNFFEKEIKGFVSFYKKRVPILKEFESVSRERE